MRVGQRHAEKRIRTKSFLVRCAVKLDELCVEPGLVKRVETGEGWRDRLIHACYCFGNALAAVSFLISVP